MRDTTNGQLYTIEGISAGLIMIMTAYLVVNATSVYTAGDTHISDMQLEALGSDALRMMGTPVNTSMNSIDTSPLRTIIENNDAGNFKAMFLNLTNNRTGLSPDYVNGIGSTMDYVQYSASYTCQKDNNVTTIPLSYSRNMTGGEHAVRATKWVIIKKNICGSTDVPPIDHAVLVEVLLWRD